MDSELIKKILLFCSGLGCFGLAVFLFVASGGSMAGVIIGAIIAMPFIYGGGLCFSLLFSPIVADRLTDFLFLPRRFLKYPPELLSYIRGLVEQERYQEAIDRLTEILARKPFDPEATLLLAEIYFDRLNDTIKGEQIVLDYFTQANHKTTGENVQLLFLYCDNIFPDSPSASQAKFLLQQELTRQGYSVPQRKLLQNRLDNLPQSSSA